MVKVLVIVLPVCAVVLSPLTLVLLAACQLYDEATLLVSASPTADPLHTAAVFALVIAGTGFTVTETVCTAPTHPPVVAVGVTE